MKQNIYIFLVHSPTYNHLTMHSHISGRIILVVGIDIGGDFNSVDSVNDQSKSVIYPMAGKSVH